jgi:hypothetical protein
METKVIKHLIEPGTVDASIGLAACGALIAHLNAAQKTRAHKKVTCQDCIDLLNERKRI